MHISYVQAYGTAASNFIVDKVSGNGTTTTGAAATGTSTTGSGVSSTAVSGAGTRMGGACRWLGLALVVAVILG